MRTGPSPAPTADRRARQARQRPVPALRLGCTTSCKGRTFAVGPHDRQLAAARAAARTEAFQQTYRRWRPMAQRTLAWLVADGHRRCRYRGVQRNQLGFSLRVAAVNLQRLLALGLGYDNGWTMPRTA